MIILLSIALKQVVGITAGCFTAGSMIPQVVKMIRDKKADQVSLVMILILISGISLWIWYGVMLNDLPIILTNLFSLVVNLIMVVLRFKYRDPKE